MVLGLTLHLKPEAFDSWAEADHQGLLRENVSTVLLMH